MMRGSCRCALWVGLAMFAATSPLLAQQAAPLGFPPGAGGEPPHPDADAEKGGANPSPGVPAPAPAPDPAPAPPTVALGGPLDALPGRWRFADGRPCSDHFGTIEVIDGHLRFEWPLGGGRVNVAVERVDRVDGNAIYTTVLSDVGTPNSEAGQRVRYTVGANRWTSENLITHSLAVHDRC